MALQVEVETRPHKSNASILIYPLLSLHDHSPFSSLSSHHPTKTFRDILCTAFDEFFLVTSENMPCPSLNRNFVILQHLVVDITADKVLMKSRKHQTLLIFWFFTKVLTPGIDKPSTNRAQRTPSL